MTLQELVEIYDGDVLFSVRETDASDEGESEEYSIISFKPGEQDALKDTLLAREVEKWYTEVNVTGDVVKKNYNVVVVIVLAEESAEEPDGTDDLENGEPEPDGEEQEEIA